MNARWSILVVLALFITGPALAVAITIDPGLYADAKARSSDRLQWNANPINGDPSAGLFGEDGGHRFGPQAVDVTPGATVNISIGSMFVGSFSADDNGVITSEYEDTAFTISGSKVTFITYPVAVDTNGYNGGWVMPQVNHQVRASNAPGGFFTYDLPVTSSGAYVLHTPGATSNGLYQDATFTVSPVDGFLSVTNPGAAGLTLVGGTTLAFTNKVEVEYQWARSDGLSPGVSWWAGDGSCAGGDDKRDSGTYVLVPGLYDIGWANLPAGAWKDGVKGFEVFNNDQGWVKTLTYTTNDDIVYTLTLTRVGVPEPATMSLLVLGGLAMLKRRVRLG